MNILEIFKQLIESSGFMALTWQQAVMIGVSFIFLFWQSSKNLNRCCCFRLPSACCWRICRGRAHAPGPTLLESGVLYIIYQGVKSSVFPCLIFLGVGAMTDFGPLLANPSSLLLGGAAQLGIYVAFVISIATGLFTPAQAAAIGIIGGADGPTAIFLATRIASELLGPIAVAAYSYMALIPLIQPPIMRLLTTKKEREVKMEQLRKVSKTEKIIFPIIVTVICVLLIPDVAPLIGMLMLGNLFRESGVTDRLNDTAQNALCNIVTIMLGVSVGATANGATFLKVQTLAIVGLGLVAFAFSTAGGVLLGKLMFYITKGKVNPLIGAAGVSAVPMAARVAQKEGRKATPPTSCSCTQWARMWRV